MIISASLQEIIYKNPLELILEINKTDVIILNIPCWVGCDFILVV